MNGLSEKRKETPQLGLNSDNNRTQTKLQTAAKLGKKRTNSAAITDSKTQTRLDLKTEQTQQLKY